MRNLSRVLFVMRRDADTNQRVYFDLDASGQRLISGDQQGGLHWWDVHSVADSLADSDDFLKTSHQFPDLHQDCLNGVSFHPSYPIVATASGQRHYRRFVDDDQPEGSAIFQPLPDGDNSVKLWWMTDLDGFNQLYSGQ